MMSILVIFVLQMLFLVHPLLGGKHLLVEVADSPESVTEVQSEHGVDYGNDEEDSPKTGKRKVANKGNDYALNEDQCEGLKKLCKGRSSCLEAIKCDGGTDTYNQTAPQDGRDLRGEKVAIHHRREGQRYRPDVERLVRSH